MTAKPHMQAMLRCNPLYSLTLLHYNLGIKQALDIIRKQKPTDKPSTSKKDPTNKDKKQLQQKHLWVEE